MGRVLNIFILIGLLLLSISCDKKKRLNENVDPNDVHFMVSQPSVAIAQFAAKCTNYDIILDSVIFLSPDNAVYTDAFNAKFLKKDEAILTGHWEAVDGMWILQFKGSIQGTYTSFSISVPYEMNVEGDE